MPSCASVRIFVGCPRILARRTSQETPERRAECILGLVPKRLSDHCKQIDCMFQPVTGQKHSPARQILHGVSPESCLNRSAKTERDMPACIPKSRNVHRRAGSACMAVIARPSCLSAKAKNHPCPGRGVPQTHPQSLHQHHVGKILRDEIATGLFLEQFVHHAFNRPTQRKLIGFLRRCTIGGSNPSSISAACR